jgi:hypothetical protein
MYQLSVSGYHTSSLELDSPNYIVSYLITPQAFSASGPFGHDAEVHSSPVSRLSRSSRGNVVSGTLINLLSLAEYVALAVLVGTNTGPHTDAYATAVVGIQASISALAIRALAAAR